MIDSRKLREIRRELEKIGVVIYGDNEWRVRMFDGREIIIEIDPDTPVVYIESWCAIKRGGFGTAYARIDEVPDIVKELDSICRSFETLVKDWDIDKVFSKMGERKEHETSKGLHLIVVYPRTVVIRKEPSKLPLGLVKFLIKDVRLHSEAEEKK